MKKAIKDYVITSEDKVQEHLAFGWNLWGSPILANRIDENGNETVGIVQALVLYESKEATAETPETEKDKVIPFLRMNSIDIALLKKAGEILTRGLKNSPPSEEFKIGETYPVSPLPPRITEDEEPDPVIKNQVRVIEKSGTPETCDHVYSLYTLCREAFYTKKSGSRILVIREVSYARNSPLQPLTINFPYCIQCGNPNDEN